MHLRPRARTHSLRLRRFASAGGIAYAAIIDKPLRRRDRSSTHTHQPRFALMPDQVCNRRRVAVPEAGTANQHCLNMKLDAEHAPGRRGRRAAWFETPACRSSALGSHTWARQNRERRRVVVLVMVIGSIRRVNLIWRRYLSPAFPRRWCRQRLFPASGRQLFPAGRPPRPVSKRTGAATGVSSR